MAKHETSRIQVYNYQKYFGGIHLDVWFSIPRLLSLTLFRIVKSHVSWLDYRILVESSRCIWILRKILNANKRIRVIWHHIVEKCKLSISLQTKENDRKMIYSLPWHLRKYFMNFKHFFFSKYYWQLSTSLSPIRKWW